MTRHRNRRPPSPGVEEAVQWLRAEIESGAITPGSVLRAHAIAAALGVTPEVARRALRLLQAEGLAHSDHRGEFVVAGEAMSADDIVELRAAIEGIAARRAQSTLRRRGFDELEGAVDYLKQAAACGDEAAALEAHLAFHRALYRAAASQPLLAVWRMIERAVRAYLHDDLRGLVVQRDFVDDHLGLLNLLRRGGPAEVRAEFEEHVWNRPGSPGAGRGRAHREFETRRGDDEG